MKFSSFNVLLLFTHSILAFSTSEVAHLDEASKIRQNAPVIQPSPPNPQDRMNVMNRTPEVHMSDYLPFPLFYNPPIFFPPMPYLKPIVNQGFSATFDLPTCRLVADLSSVHDDANVIVELVGQTAHITTSYQDSNADQGQGYAFHSSGSSQSTTMHSIPPPCHADPTNTTAELSKASKILTITFPMDPTAQPSPTDSFSSISSSSSLSFTSSSSFGNANKQAKSLSEGDQTQQLASPINTHNYFQEGNSDSNGLPRYQIPVMRLL